MQHGDGSGRKITRRELICQGLLSASGLVMAPAAISALLGKEAYAASCLGAQMPLMPFLLFDCAGGAALAGNFVVGRKGGAQDYLQSYDQMGVPRSPQLGEPVDLSFGAPMYSSLSKIYQGLKSTASKPALAMLRFVTVCSATQDDVPFNILSPLLLVSKAGLKGSLIENSVGTRPTLSGGVSRGPLEEAHLRPLYVKGASDVVNAVNYGPALQRLSSAQRQSLATTLARLSGIQIEKFKKMTLGQEMDLLQSCGYKKNAEFARAAADVDPRFNAHCQDVYKINPDTDNFAAQIPAIVLNVISGQTGPGVITIEGCDYHDGTQTTGDQKDLQIGETIGRAVEIAHRYQRPLFFALVSDGSCFSDLGTRIWRGDAGSKGLTVMGCYHPSKMPSIRKFQLGEFTDGQAVERSTYIGNSSKRTSFAILANYLSANGRMDLFSQVAKNEDFDAKQLDEHLAFIK